MDAGMLDNLSFNPPADSAGPSFYRGHFEISSPADTFLDLRNWNLGAVWVNGRNLGRYWSIGPQQTLYCPGCWLRKGTNDILVFDLEGGGPKSTAGLDEPILDEVR
jgi:beta-galactosidase